MAAWFDALRRKESEENSIKASDSTPDKYARESDWDDYPLGKHRPTRARLDLVETALAGTREIFDYGPGGLPIWSVVGSSDLTVLRAMKLFGEEVVHEIAAIKLDAMAGHWRRHPELEYALFTGDLFELANGPLNRIFGGLAPLMDCRPALMIIEHLSNWLRVHAEDALSEFIGESRYSAAEVDRVNFEAALLNIYNSAYDKLADSPQGNAPTLPPGSDFVADEE